MPEIFVTLGPCDGLRAEVFFRVARPARADRHPDPPRLAGTLTGPACRLATTLPTTVRLVDLGTPPGQAASRHLVARAVLTEPGYWTPELPNLYRLRAEVRAGEAVVATITAEIGLRRLGVRGRSFLLDGRRWVPRGVRAAAGLAVETFRASTTAAVFVDPDAAECSRLDGAGVAVVAVPGSPGGGMPDTASVTERLLAWSVHPAVCLVMLPPGITPTAAAGLAAAVRSFKGTMLLGWWVDGGEPPPADVPAGIDWLAVAVGRSGTAHAGWRDAAPLLPLVACGGTEGRAGCDTLQAALAAWGLADGRDRLPWDWAGYLVW